MPRKYDKELLTKMKERETKMDYHGAEVLVKNLPDCDERSNGPASL